MSSWVLRVDHDAKPLVVLSGAVGQWFIVHVLLTATWFFGYGNIYMAFQLIAACLTILACILGAIGVPITHSKSVAITGAILVSAAVIFELLTYIIVELAQSRIWSTEVSVMFLVDLGCLIALLILFIRRIKYLRKLFGDNEGNDLNNI